MLQTREIIYGAMPHNFVVLSKNQSENEAILVSIQRPQVSKGQRFSFAVKCWMLIILLILNIDDEC